MLVGLQGTGKTTTAGKLAAWLKQTGKHPMLAACDIYRPAAIDQLEIVGKAVNTPVYVNRDCQDAEQIGRLSVRKLVEKIEHSRTCVDEEIPVTGELLEGSSVSQIN